MEMLHNSEGKINRTTVSIAVAVTCVLVGIFAVTKLNKKNEEPVHQLVVMQPVKIPDLVSTNGDHSSIGVLKQRLYDLQSLQQQFNTIAATGENKQAIENSRTAVVLSQEAFRATIDSVWIAAIADRNVDSLQLKTIAAYRSSLDSIRNVNSAFNIATSDNDFMPDRKTYLKLQDELMDKTNKIALLESSIELMKNQGPITTPGSNTEKNNGIEAADMAALESKVTELTAGNIRLQEEVERLRKLPAEPAKNNTAEQLLLSKNTALQHKVNSINAELQLVRVDCNLSRVDANQIISNSKQRKLLLSEASGILSELSVNSDADIRNRVKEKIVRLNQVAANTRD